MNEHMVLSAPLTLAINFIKSHNPVYSMANKPKCQKKSLKLNKKDTVLVICAHPDDEILGAGGTIAKY